MEYLNIWEAKTLHILHDALQCGFFDWLMPIVTSLGNAGIFWILLAVVLLCFKKTRKVGITMGIALAFGFIVVNLTLKPLVARVRPYVFDSTITLLISPETDFSFPSGHTLASFEGAVSIFLYNKKFGIAAILLASLIAFSRLYLMVHYPMDVLAGILLGSAIAIVAFKLTEAINKHYKIQL